MNELREKGAAVDAAKDIIGQFGVGFYSAFMVGDRVDVTSRSARGGDATLWSSDGSGQFTVATLTPEQAGLAHGTKIVIHLRAGERVQPCVLLILALLEKGVSMNIEIPGVACIHQQAVRTMPRGAASRQSSRSTATSWVCRSCSTTK